MTLFDVPAVGVSRISDPETSREAAATCDAQRQRDVLLRELRSDLCGLTADQLEDRTGIPRYIVASRLAQMRRSGDVEPFGTRENRAGRRVQIWFPVTGVANVSVERERL